MGRHVAWMPSMANMMREESGKAPERCTDGPDCSACNYTGKHRA